MTQAEKWRVLRRVLLITIPPAMLVGFGIGWLIGGAGTSMVAGATIGLFVGAGIITFDVSWAIGLIPRGWREAPFLVVLITRSLVWLVIIVIGISVPLLTIAQLSPEDVFDQTFAIAVAVSFIAALVFNFIGQVNRLLGPGMLVSLLVGRYHRPREEVRVFLFIDLRDSTRIAEELGNLRYHSLLKRFISDVTASVIRYRGEVHRYVGDEVILTWLADEGLRDARCVRTVFGIDDTLEEARAEYEQEFGVVPSFWAGLHIGPVVAGEIGTVKHEIAFIGDTMNEAARIEEACKQFDRHFVASGDVITALEPAADIAVEGLGDIELRGVGEPVELFAVAHTDA